MPAVAGFRKDWIRLETHLFSVGQTRNTQGCLTGGGPEPSLPKGPFVTTNVGVG